MVSSETQGIGKLGLGLVVSVFWWVRRQCSMRAPCMPIQNWQTVVLFARLVRRRRTQNGSATVLKLADGNTRVKLCFSSSPLNLTQVLCRLHSGWIEAAFQVSGKNEVCFALLRCDSLLNRFRFGFGLRFRFTPFVCLATDPDNRT